MPERSNTPTIEWFSDLSLTDLDQVGGKNASLGEMIRNLTSAARARRLRNYSQGVPTVHCRPRSG
jgi:hypothetical protein